MKTDQFKVMRKGSHDARVAALRDGRKERAVTFRAKKGPGSYQRPQRTRVAWR